VFGGNPGTIRSEQALRFKVVRRVVPLGAGVAVAADGFWSAHLGQQALVIEWVLAPHPANTTAVLRSQLHEVASESGTRVRASGDTAAALKAATRVIEAEYETPLQAHATREPMCCTADVRRDGRTIWAPTQQPTGAQRAASSSNTAVGRW